MPLQPCGIYCISADLLEKSKQNNFYLRIIKTLGSTSYLSRSPLESFPFSKNSLSDLLIRTLLVMAPETPFNTVLSLIAQNISGLPASCVVFRSCVCECNSRSRISDNCWQLTVMDIWDADCCIIISFYPLNPQHTVLQFKITHKKDKNSTQSKLLIWCGADSLVLLFCICSCLLNWFLSVLSQNT